MMLPAVVLGVAAGRRTPSRSGRIAAARPRAGPSVACRCGGCVVAVVADELKLPQPLVLTAALLHQAAAPFGPICMDWWDD